jgi:pimeloyl-ACP methyl ester carboxylesterase
MRMRTGRIQTCLRWAARLFVLGACVVALLLATGYVYQQLATRRDQQRFPMRGQMVQVDGHRMHLDCEGTGQPTVVLDSGLGDSFAAWALVQPKVAEFTRVCSYDRPGFGWSDEADVPRDSDHVAHQLHELLVNAGIAGPYILVGHSFGGLNQLVFRSLYPHDVAGMVLVDSSHPDQLSLLPAATSIEAYAASIRYHPLGAVFGFGRVLGWCRDDYTFPEAGEAWQRVAPEAIALDCRIATFRATRDEALAFRESAREAGSAGTLGPLPLVVLSHDPRVGIGFLPETAAQAEPAWNQMQEELRVLSTNSHRVIAAGSRHYVESYRPELVVAAIREVYDAVRTGESIAAATVTK